MTSDVFINIGNTSLSYGWSEKDRSVRSVTFERRSFQKFTSAVLQRLRDTGSKTLLVASTVPELTLSLKQQITGQSIQIKVLKPLDLRAFVSGRVALHQVGIDRLLSSYEASEAGSKDAISVDLGTALTVNIVQKSKFQGGIILPGLQMAKSALTAGSSQIKTLRPVLPGSVLIGRNTDQCIDIGQTHVISMALCSYIHIIKKKLRKNCAVIFTGGGYNTLKRYVDCSHSYDSNLVLNGMVAWQKTQKRFS